MRKVEANQLMDYRLSTEHLNHHELDYQLYLKDFQNVSHNALSDAVHFTELNALLGNLYQLSPQNHHPLRTLPEILVDLAHQTPVLSRSFFYYDFPQNSNPEINLIDIETQLNSPELIRLSNLACLVMTSRCQSMPQFHANMQSVSRHYWRLKNQVQSEFQNSDNKGQFSIFCHGYHREYLYSGFMTEAEPFGILKAIFKQNIYNAELGQENHQRLAVKSSIEKKLKFLSRRIQKISSTNKLSTQSHVNSMQHIILTTPKTAEQFPDDLISNNINYFDLDCLEKYAKILDIILDSSAEFRTIQDLQQLSNNISQSSIQAMHHQLNNNSPNATDLRIVKKDYQKLNKLLDQVTSQSSLSYK
ncbi:MAG: hypothetical protein OXF30_02975 [Candidatus Saccharibacteria bacterium]|nr:hypothetical protein [Candidatus Saccharibacteria bacterium]